MIYVRLFGRLGNQMFQYAAARSLAHRLGTAIALDTREVTRRGEGVLTRVFDLPVEPATRLPPDRAARPLRYLAWRWAGRHPRLRRERGLGYNTAFAGWGDDSYLHGYWQSAAYFTNIADQIRRDFAFPTNASPQSTAMARHIRDSLSVSMHIRRGDYLALGTHPVCDAAYYTAALETLRRRLGGTPTVFVFSDDPDWARGNLPLPVDKVVVDFNQGDRDYEDMQLMSFCRHNIIGNSSFSWWGAWLNTSAERLVVAPKRWYGTPRRSNPDILPPDWLSV